MRVFYYCIKTKSRRECSNADSHDRPTRPTKLTVLFAGIILSVWCLLRQETESKCEDVPLIFAD